MKKKSIAILGLMLPLVLHSQTWKVYGVDSLADECKIYSDITIFNNRPWAGISQLEGTTFINVETPSMLFICDVSEADSKGNIWFVGSVRADVWATHGNAFMVFKYDGKNWNEYSPSKSFGYSACNSIAFQNDTLVWFTTTDKGAFMYDGSIWQQYKKQGVFDGANAMAIDNEGNKWFATSKGLVKLAGSDWTVYSKENSGLKYNVINDITIDTHGNIWLAAESAESGNEGKIVKFDGTNWTYFNPFNNVGEANDAYAVSIDSSGKIWAGTHSGLSSFNGSSWKNYNYPQLSSNTIKVTSIDFDTSGSVWLGSSCGIWQFQDKATSIKLSLTDNVKLSPNPATSLVEIMLPREIQNGDIFISDMNGIWVLKTKIFNDINHINISNLRNGVYLVHIITAQSHIIKKLIKE